MTIAIIRGNIRIVDALIKHNVDINYPYETDFDTPMMGAIREDQDAILQLLISRGADPYKRNNYGENLFAFAKRWHYTLPPELVEEPQVSLVQVIGRAIKKRFGLK